MSRNLIRLIFLSSCFLLPTSGYAENCGIPHRGNTSQIKASIFNKIITQPSGVQRIFDEPAVFSSDNLHIEGFIRNWMEVLLENACSDTKVTIVNYDWDKFWNSGPPWGQDGWSEHSGPKSWKALTDAILRGVDVSIALPVNKASKEPTLSIITEIKKLNNIAGAGRVNVYICDDDSASSSSQGSCIGNHNLHAKFMLFEKVKLDTDVVRNIIVAGSQNLDVHTLRTTNDAFYIPNDSKLYTEFKNYSTNIFNKNKNFEYTSTNGSSGVKAYFFPRKSGDTVISIFNNVNCGIGARIHIAMSIWSDSIRGRSIADKLIDMQEDGCEIDILESAMDGSIKNRLMNGGVNVISTDFPYKIHSKFFIIKGSYLGKSSYLVFTGSPNFTEAGLRQNEEVLMKLNSSVMYYDYKSHWNRSCHRNNANCPR